MCGCVCVGGWGWGGWGPSITSSGTQQPLRASAGGSRGLKPLNTHVPKRCPENNNTLTKSRSALLVHGGKHLAQAFPPLHLRSRHSAAPSSVVEGCPILVPRKEAGMETANFDLGVECAAERLYQGFRRP